MISRQGAQNAFSSNSARARVMDYFKTGSLLVHDPPSQKRQIAH
ncbi:hypothetical protein [Maricaulis sp.]|jgi:hypothetical protein|nr:hypothetical protein [Maricaulis sp.]